MHLFCHNLIEALLYSFHANSQHSFGTWLIVHLSFHKLWTCFFIDLQILAFNALAWLAFFLLCKNKWHCFSLNTVMPQPQQSPFTVNFIYLINPVVSFSTCTFSHLFFSFESLYMFLNITSPIPTAYITAHTNARLDVTAIKLRPLYQSLNAMIWHCKELSQSVYLF